MTSTYVLTGATSGLGLHIATRLCRTTDAALIVGARTPATADALREAIPADRLTMLPLDLTALSSVRSFADAILATTDAGSLAGILCIAGLQETAAASLTPDGIETTFAANHLGHFALVEALRDALRLGGAIITIGSGTHNPDDRLARMFGFRGAVATDPAAMSTGRLGRPGTVSQQALDRYATSKLCAILHARHLGRTLDPDAARIYCFDPGLMPGTGLARDRSAVQRFGWSYLLPNLRHFVRGISTPELSAGALVKLILEGGTDTKTGAYVEFTGRPAPRSLFAENDALALDLFTYCQQIATSNTPLEAPP